MNRIRLNIFVLGCLLIVFACKERRSEKLVELAVQKDTFGFTALPTNILSPANNPQTKEKIALGKLLFYDPILSGGKDVACATCHHPKTGYAEFLDVSIGSNGKGFGGKRRFKKPNNIPFVKRNAHTILNTAFNGLIKGDEYSPEDAPMFWDVRAKSLESQALLPIKSFEEMRGAAYSEEEILRELENRLSKIPEYKKLFKNVFGTHNAISAENIAKAIAAFERTLVTNNSRFDQYMKGDSTAIQLSEKEGFALFKKIGCAGCHSGPMFTDYKTHLLGVPENEKIKQIDSGLSRTFEFRTPTLRNLRFTAPYMHNGSFVSLKKVMEFYEDISNDKVRNKNIAVNEFDPLVKELDFSAKDISLIISFLNTLNDDDFDKEIPEKVPSGLPVGGDIQ